MYVKKGSSKPLAPLRERKCIIATEAPTIIQNSENPLYDDKHITQLPPLLIAGDYCEGSLGRGTVSGAILSGERAAHFVQEIWKLGTHT